MVQFNFLRREVICKIVYYGRPVSGKATNMNIVYQKTPNSNRVPRDTENQVISFDFMPIDLGTIAGMKTKMKLCAVPGALYGYHQIQKSTLQDADGVILVIDSQRKYLQENIDYLQKLASDLAENGKDIHTFPVVIQWNKRDMPDILSADNEI